MLCFILIKYFTPYCYNIFLFPSAKQASLNERKIKLILIDFVFVEGSGVCCCCRGCFLHWMKCFHSYSGIMGYKFSPPAVQHKLSLPSPFSCLSFNSITLFASLLCLWCCGAHNPLLQLINHQSKEGRKKKGNTTLHFIQTISLIEMEEFVCCPIIQLKGRKVNQSIFILINEWNKIDLIDFFPSPAAHSMEPINLIERNWRSKARQPQSTINLNIQSKKFDWSVGWLVD